MSFAFLPLYTGDYLRDTADLTLTEHGIYIRLLMYSWDSRGPVPADEARAARIVGASSDDERNSVKVVLKRYFVRHDDGWYNPRMDKEIAHANAISSVRSEAGRRGGANSRQARLRAGKAIARANASAIASTNAIASDATPTPTPTTTPTTTPTATNPVGGATAPPTTPRCAKPAVSTPPKKPKPDPKIEPAAKGSGVWDAYAAAYFQRYGVDPVRNARVNKNLSTLVDLLGADAAPPVAASFLRSQRALYVNSKHDTTLLVRDASKLHTEWVQGAHATDTEGRHADRAGGMGNVAAKVAAEFRAKAAQEESNASE